MIQGVGGSNCSSDEVEIEPQKRDGSKVQINALVVDKIVTTVTKDIYKVRQMIQHSINILRQDPRYRKAQTTNFQELLGGRVEMLLGQNVRDFHPENIKKLSEGLIISSMRISQLDEERYLGFAGTFPTRFSPVYQKNNHPKVLAIEESQELAEHENEQVFRLPLSDHSLQLRIKI